jgi:hypothetical protein
MSLIGARGGILGASGVAAGGGESVLLVGNNASPAGTTECGADELYYTVNGKTAVATGTPAKVFL